MTLVLKIYGFNNNNNNNVSSGNLSTSILP